MKAGTLAKVWYLKDSAFRLDWPGRVKKVCPEQLRETESIEGRYDKKG